MHQNNFKMVSTIKNICLAMIGGSFLSLMIQINSFLAKDTSPLFASWVAHGVGAITALTLLLLTYRLLLKQSETKSIQEKKKLPLWLYLGGIPGAFTVVLAAVAINGGVSLSSTISLGLVGQIMFGIVSDHFGLFNTKKRKITIKDIYVISLVMAGSMMILFGA